MCLGFAILSEDKFYVLKIAQSIDESSFLIRISIKDMVFKKEDVKD